jgi:hypothetical protein
MGLSLSKEDDNISSPMSAVATDLRRDPQQCFFKPALFYQQMQSWHIADAALEFKMDMATGINQARFPSAGIDLESGPEDRLQQAINEATKVVEVGRGYHDALIVAEKLRDTCTWGDDDFLRYLIRSCYVTEDVALPALGEACGRGFRNCVVVLLEAGVSGTKAIPNTSLCKNALHIACENGQEACAMEIVDAMISSTQMDERTSNGLTALEILKNSDLNGMARRLEKHAQLKFQPGSR